MFRFRAVIPPSPNACALSQQWLRTYSSQNARRLRSLAALPVSRNLSSSAIGQNTCPACSAPLPTALPVCPRCSFIAPVPDSMTYHEMLGTPYEPNPFVVNVPELKQQFRKVQAVVHPDRWVAKPPVSSLTYFNTNARAY